MYFSKSFTDEHANEIAQFLRRAIGKVGYGYGQDRLMALTEGGSLAVYEESDDEDHKGGYTEWRYEDCWYGDRQFAGTMTIFYKGVVCWVMAYRGHLDDHHFAGKDDIVACLKAALAYKLNELPLRGPRLYEHPNGCCYENFLDGNILEFIGHETIKDVTDQRVFTFKYVGGSVNT